MNHGNWFCNIIQSHKQTYVKVEDVPSFIQVISSFEEKVNHHS